MKFPTLPTTLNPAVNNNSMFCKWKILQGILHGKNCLNRKMMSDSKESLLWNCVVGIVSDSKDSLLNHVDLDSYHEQFLKRKDS